MFENLEDEKKEKLLNQISFIKILIPIVGIIIANIQMWQLIIRKNNEIQFIIFYVLFNLIGIYLIIDNIKKKKEIERNKIYAEFLKDENEGLMTVNDTVRCFKHDFNNIIQAIDGYLMIGDMAALKIYFSKLLKECNHVKNLEILTINNLKNPAIYGILLNKYTLAENQKINMNIEIATDLSNIKEESYIISKIIGILLDNAIEASGECEEKIINVQFIQSGINLKKIIIENTYLNKEINTEEIFEKGVSSKKSKGNSGLGLWEIKNILNKNQNMWLATTKNSRFFRQELEILVK